MNTDFEVRAILSLQQECIMHGISFCQLCDRLKRGCSLFAAMNMPSSWEIGEITRSSDSDIVHYNMRKPIDVDAVTPIFEGTEKDLQEFLDEIKWIV